MFATTAAFAPNNQHSHMSKDLESLSTTSTTTLHQTTNKSRSQPRSGFAQNLLNLALASPLWEYVLVPQARASIVKTAEGMCRLLFLVTHIAIASYHYSVKENGIPWVSAKKWLETQPDAPWNNPNNNIDIRDYEFPDYYTKSFHAYSDGNLSYRAAFEQELASRSIGARNFPKFKDLGEDVFRGAFDKALNDLGATALSSNEEDVVIVDFGCGTGTSTRRLAARYPEAAHIIGIDLSPFFIDVGQTLLKLGPNAINENDTEGWITKVDSDPRVQLQQGNIGNTKLPSNFASVVNIALVLHELPLKAAKEVVTEAYRILKPGGQMWISEMDFEAPAYKAQRENAMLFSLLRATEPYLDEYADGMPGLRNFIVDTFSENANNKSTDKGFVRITAATGRHYALLAQKGGNGEASKVEPPLNDTRFLEDGSYALQDTHLKPWESKEAA